MPNHWSSKQSIQSLKLATMLPMPLELSSQDSKRPSLSHSTVSIYLFWRSLHSKYLQKLKNFTVFLFVTDVPQDSLQTILTNLADFVQNLSDQLAATKDCHSSITGGLKTVLKNLGLDKILGNLGL